jgi:hypothetical protein
MADEEQAREQSSWLSWLLQPWLVPLAAAAMLGAIVFSPWLTGGRAPKSEMPSLPSLSSPGSLAKRPPADPPLAEKPAAPAPQALAKKDPPKEDLPKDLIQRPELFVDYAVIRDLDVLEAGDAGAGKAG